MKHIIFLSIATITLNTNMLLAMHVTKETTEWNPSSFTVKKPLYNIEKNSPAKIDELEVIKGYYKNTAILKASPTKALPEELIIMISTDQRPFSELFSLAVDTAYFAQRKTVIIAPTSHCDDAKIDEEKLKIIVTHPKIIFEKERSFKMQMIGTELPFTETLKKERPEDYAYFSSITIWRKYMLKEYAAQGDDSLRHIKMALELKS